MDTGPSELIPIFFKKQKRKLKTHAFLKNIGFISLGPVSMLIKDFYSKFTI